MHILPHNESSSILALITPHMFLVLRQPIKKFGRGFLVRMRFSSAVSDYTHQCRCIALYMPPRRRGDVSGISLMGRAFVAATSERRRSAVAAMSQRRRSDVADDNAPLGIGPLGHRTFNCRRAQLRTEEATYVRSLVPSSLVPRPHPYGRRVW